MKFSVERERLLKPLQHVSAALSSRPILPILYNLLLEVKDRVLFLIGTDLEMQIAVRILLTKECQLGMATIPARKFFEICRGLPVGSEIFVYLEGDRIFVRSDRSRFSLVTLPATDFPNLDHSTSEVAFIVNQRSIKHLIEATQFSMANQDVRYYLNGMLFETVGTMLYIVSTDGHRLSIGSMSLDKLLASYSVIVPRKGVTELSRLLDDSETPLEIELGKNNIRISIGSCVFTSKLVDGRFPDYRSAISSPPIKTIEVNREALKKSLMRASILSNSKSRSVCLHISENQFKITAQNQEKEEAEEILDVIYHGSQIEIGLNVSYILDVLNTLKCNNVCISLSDSTSSVHIKDAVMPFASYIIMPIRL
ncbi:DNA polymerase III subunit beta [Candidatus Erwinia haradaeae]|uniref:Beta sliding clamp n=1 Tax=Candidatus Erwinia haradaeae TaxID=1922217 RepID=A0A451D346_9GAMM|nr:DNA polymerase III subunit beta [Candidatus Erwinia haradaeae]VFP80084.1 Beta sliding clamp [Candidatus Erwinia haradaeae]